MNRGWEEVPRARIPADVEAPDRIVYGLTARQLAILTLAVACGYILIRTAGHLLPAPVLVAVCTPLAGVAIVVAVGRRDGIPLDQYLAAALRFTHVPRRHTSAHAAPPPAWAPESTRSGPRVPLLRLPAHAITSGGVVEAGTQAVALVACTTVNLRLRTGEEQAAVIGAYARWLNSLTTPTQIVISAQRVDLSHHAQRLQVAALAMTNPALAELTSDYAVFLGELTADVDPLWRTVTIAVTAPTTASGGGEVEVLRHADHTATALGALGARTRVLDASEVTGVLACAVDPYAPTDASWPRTAPDTVLTARGRTR